MHEISFNGVFLQRQLSVCVMFGQGEKQDKCKSLVSYNLECLKDAKMMGNFRFSYLLFEGNNRGSVSK